jgi:hypothetical protein
MFVSEGATKTHPARRYDEVALLNPTDVPKRGRKNGGTKSGKTPIEVPARRKQNEGSLKSLLLTEFCHQLEVRTDRDESPTYKSKILAPVRKG